MAPMASAGRTWLASSIRSKSNFSLPGARYCATDKGLMRKTGLIATTASAAVSRSLRKRMWRFFLLASPRTIPTIPAEPLGREPKCFSATSCEASS